MSKKKSTLINVTIRKDKGIIWDINLEPTKRKTLKTETLSEDTEQHETLLDFLTNQTNRLNEFVSSKSSFPPNQNESDRVTMFHEDYVTSIRKYAEIVAAGRHMRMGDVAKEVYYINRRIREFLRG